MLARRLFGDSVSDIAEEFKLSPQTVQRRLSSARAEGALVDARAIIIESMLPKAMAVMQEALDGDDMKIAVQVALKIVDGLHTLDPVGGAAPPGRGVEETLEMWRLKRVRLAEPMGVIDVEVQQIGAGEQVDTESPEKPQSD